MALNGYLNLGTALSGSTVVTPPSGTNYAAQPVSFTSAPGGGQINNVLCTFGPVSGSWGTLTVFGVTDGSGNPLTPPGTLQQPFTPLNGQLVVVPPGDVSVVVGAQFAAGPGSFISRPPPSAPIGPLNARIALGGVSVTVFAASGIVNVADIINPVAAPGTLYIDLVATASSGSATSIPLSAGQAYRVSAPVGNPVTAVSAFSGHAFVAVSY